MIRYFVLLIIQINYFWGELTDIPDKTKSLLTTTDAGEVSRTFRASVCAMSCTVMAGKVSPGTAVKLSELISDLVDRNLRGSAHLRSSDVLSDVRRHAVCAAAGLPTDRSEVLSGVVIDARFALRERCVTELSSSVMMVTTSALDDESTATSREQDESLLALAPGVEGGEASAYQALKAFGMELVEDRCRALQKRGVTLLISTVKVSAPVAWIAHRCGITCLQVRCMQPMYWLGRLQNNYCYYKLKYVQHQSIPNMLCFILKINSLVACPPSIPSSIISIMRVIRIVWL